MLVIILLILFTYISTHCCALAAAFVFVVYTFFHYSKPHCDLKTLACPCSNMQVPKSTIITIPFFFFIGTDYCNNVKYNDQNLEVATSHFVG